MGIPRTKPIQAATGQAARSLGLESTTGRVRQGLQADLLVVGADPLRDLRVLAPGDHARIDGVIAGGRLLRWDRQDLI